MTRFDYGKPRSGFCFKQFSKNDWGEIFIPIIPSIKITGSAKSMK